MSGSLSAIIVNTPRDMAQNSIIQIPEVGMQLPGVVTNTALLCAALCRGVGKLLHTLPSHPTMGELITTGFS